METWIRRDYTINTQKRELFTGEGAYHGSTKPRPPQLVRPPTEIVEEARPTTFERYLREGRKDIESFDAEFPNRFRIETQLRVPTQEEVRTDGVTFCWCPFDEALSLAGPVSKEVLLAIRPRLKYRKRFIYVDSKIQYFEVGDLPVDSELLHCDGTITVRDDRVRVFGANILHDMKARFDHLDPPTYFAYLSSTCSDTCFVEGPTRIRLPTLIPDFKSFDALVRATQPRLVPQPAGSLGSFDGLSLHTATAATVAGWRLWLRVMETDVEIIPSPSVIDCYGTVFQKRVNR